MKLVPAGPKRADAQREMRRQNGQRDTKFLFSSGRDDFFLSESFCKTAATALIRIAESCLSCIWAGYLVDHHDGVDRVRTFSRSDVSLDHPPPLPLQSLPKVALPFRARIKMSKRSAPLQVAGPALRSASGKMRNGEKEVQIAHYFTTIAP